MNEETMPRIIGILSEIGDSLIGQLNSPEQVTGMLSLPEEIPLPYTLPPATTGTLGGVIVGQNLLVTQEGVLSVDTANNSEEDNTRPITASAVYKEVGNINAILATI